MANYELIDETNGVRYKYLGWRILGLFLLNMFSAALVYRIWSNIYGPHYCRDIQKCPFKQSVTPSVWVHRASLYSIAGYQKQNAESHDFRLVKNSTFRLKYIDAAEYTTTEVNKVAITPEPNNTLIVCYYCTADTSGNYTDLNLTDVDGSLCTHINVGMAFVHNSSIAISNDFKNVLLNDIPQLKKNYPLLKILLWIGGGGSSSDGFSGMVRNHQSRKLFIQSLKLTLQTYKLDGCDLDWEFPSAYNRERIHFSQLLYEIRQEYNREKKPYLLSLAVAAPEGISLFAYDVAEINKYADHVNLMTYDYHFYTKGTPFTGINAPLYARQHNDHSILATLNINYSVNWWIKSGLERKKLIVGLPTYGHSFSLVNPFNTKIGSPAKSYGSTGDQGFVSAGEICWFLQNNILSSSEFDKDSCSPYASSGKEWISFENWLSLSCKAHYIKKLRLGGAMIFSLNTDDFKGICSSNKFSLTGTVYNILKK